MKKIFIVKHKWFALVLSIIFILTTISISYSFWDSSSVAATMKENSSGWYTQKPTKYVLAEDKFLSDGALGINGLADVGDIVAFGNYYQSADISSKTPLRWVVVEKNKTALTLLSEKVIAFGNFWGNCYYLNGSPVWDSIENGWFYQNYSSSTLRAWLNSEYNLRNDGGANFSLSNETVKFRGFFNEAFSADEQAYIIPKKIENMMGYSKDTVANGRKNNYETICDKVWVPSWSEIFGTKETPITDDLGDNKTYDGTPNARFSYFNNTDYKTNNNKLMVMPTEFAAIPILSNYTTLNTHDMNNAQNYQSGQNVWWWLRSAAPLPHGRVMMINAVGQGSGYDSAYSSGGVRPAISLPI